MTHYIDKRKRPAGGMAGRDGDAFSSGAGPKMRRHRTVKRQPRQAGAEAAALISDLRFRRRVQHLERLGNRVTGELLAQLAVAHDCRPQIERFIDRAVEHEAAIKEFGFDKWPLIPLREVRR